MEAMNVMFVFYIAVGLIIITMGGLFLTRKKFVYRNLYNMLFIIVIVMVPQIMRLFYLKPYFGDAFVEPYIYLGYGTFFLVAIPLSYFFAQQRYSVVNADGKMVEEALLAVLAEEGIKYEVEGTKIRLTDYDGFITYRPPLLLNEVGIDFRHIRKLPFFKRLKDSFIHRVKHIETTVFPSLGIFLMLLGLVFIVFLVVIQWKFQQIL